MAHEELIKAWGPTTIAPRSAAADLKRDLAAGLHAAIEGAKKRDRELMQAGVKWNVQEGERVVDQLHDVMGFALIKFPGPQNRNFLSAFRAMSGGDDIIHVPGGRVYLNTAYGGGFSLSFFTDSLNLGPHDQYMSVNEAAQSAGLQVLERAGWLRGARVQTRID